MSEEIKKEEQPIETTPEAPASDTPQEQPDHQAEIEKLKAEIAEKDEQLMSERNTRAKQAQNFKRLRDMTKEEKEKLSVVEQQLLEKQEIIDDMQAKQKNEWKSDAFKQLAGSDEEMAKKLEVAWDELASPEDTKEEILQKATKAYNMLGVNAQPNPLMKAVNTTGKVDEKVEEKSFADSDDGKALGNLLGIKLDTPEDNK